MAIEPALGLTLCYSITHAFHKQHVRILCATVDFVDNYKLIPGHIYLEHYNGRFK